MAKPFPLSQQLLSIMREELCGKPSHIPDVSDAAVSELLALAGRHDLSHLVADCFLRRHISGELKSALDKEKAKAEFRYYNQSYVLSEISKRFEDHEIEFVPLKGAVLCELYPEAWMRTSADIDILVHEEDIKRAAQLIKDELGMEQTFHGSHDIKFCYRKKVIVELHFRLIENGRVNEASRILNDIWQYTTGDGLRKRLTNEMLYFYHITHMAKHFENGGCGIRPFMDLWLIEQQMSLDKEKTEALLRACNLYIFSEKSTAIAKKWFSGIPCEGTEQIEEFIVDGGCFGSLSKSVAFSKEKKGGSLGYLRSKLFVPYDYLRTQYPAVENRRYLTPVYEVVRWFRFLLPDSRANTLSVMKALKNSSPVDTSVMKDMGLL